MSDEVQKLTKEQAEVVRELMSLYKAMSYYGTYIGVQDDEQRVQELKVQLGLNKETIND